MRSTTAANQTGDVGSVTPVAIRNESSLAPKSHISLKSYDKPCQSAPDAFNDEVEPSSSGRRLKRVMLLGTGQSLLTRLYLIRSVIRRYNDASVNQA